MSDYFDDAAGEAEEGEAEGNELPADPDDDDPGDNIEHSDGAEDQEEGGNQPQDSSEEEEEEDNEYDLTDKFIAQEDEEDEDAEGDGEGHGKRRKHRHKRRREKSPELDDDDYQLLAENQVTGIRRKQQSTRKRIRKQQDNQNKTEAQKLQEELFGIDDGVGIDDEVQEDNRTSAVDEFAISEDEMDDFIDDDDGNGTRGRGRVRTKGAPQGVSNDGIQEMQEVFGDVDDLLEMYAEKKATVVLSKDDDNDEPIEPADEEDPDAVAAYEEQLKLRKQQRRQKRMQAAIEPELMEKLMMLPLDERIRETDAPERFQLSGQADLKDAFTEEQLDDAARFILEQLIGPSPTDLAAMGDQEVVAKDRNAQYLLEHGLLEVDGKPRDKKKRPHKDFWERGELMEDLTDLTRGQRGVRRPRDRTARAAWRSNPASRDAVVNSITNVLKQMWEQKHEIPLIASFRKQLCGELLSLNEKDRPDLTDNEEVRARRRSRQPDFEVGTVQAKHRRLRRWDILWAVYDLSAKWRAILRRKEKRSEVYQQALSRCDSWIAGQDGQSSGKLSDIAEAIRSCIADTADARSMETLDDIETKFKLVTSGLGETFAEDLALGVRRPQRSSAYSLLKQANLEDVIKAMAMPAAELGDNLERFLKRNQPEDPRSTPADLAYSHVTSDPLLDDPDKVLERARQVHVLEIVNEPRVRAFIRRQMDENMVTTTGPTTAGEGQLDAFHPYGCVKRLKNMPALEFNGTDLYLRIHLAQKEGLINVVSEVANLEDLFVQPMLEFYQSSGVSALSKEWNAVRQAILREAVKKLVPQLQEETGNRLLAEAKEAVVEKYGDELWKYASLPPVQMKSEEGDVVERRRIAACCWGEGRPATCLVMLDEQGSLVDILYLPSFSGPQRIIRTGLDYSIAEDPKKAADVKRVVEFCRENRPQAIFVGARNLNCKALKEDVSRIGDFILDAHAQILTSGHDTGTIEILYSEETLAELWANSAAAREEFPDHPDVVRRAVALGRLALEPLAVLAALCRSDGKEILSLNLHSLQAHVPDTELLKQAERCLMTVVAQVGADINAMASNMWQAATLPFVAGLGPRKAQSLLQAVQAEEFALNRVSLWKDIWKPGNAVFRNCGAFLKITAKARSLVNAEVEVIDSARIEPLSYKLAFRIARAAVGSTANDPQQDIIHTNKAISRPEMVEALDLEELHDTLASESSDPESYNQISTLVDIAMEFIAPNMELRQGNLMEISVQKEKQFWWMVEDTPQNLKPGRRVEAVVRYVGQNEVKCSLPELGDLDATISAIDISSAGPVTPSDYLKAGQSINARIKLVRPEDFCVEISTTSTDLNDEASWEQRYSKANNRYYHVLSSEERRAIDAEKRRLARSKELTKRTIDHPNFRNISINEAVRQLEELPIGEAIFRPHPKTTELICLTIKLHKTSEGDLVIHKDVQEGRKRGGQLTLGTPLKIQLSSGGGMNNQLTFEDLDEIIARYVEPMCERFQEVIKHRKFREGSWDAIKISLYHEVQGKHPTFSTYCLCIDEVHPGSLYIACVLPTVNRTPRKEYFAVSPEGFYFRRKNHKTLEKMLAVFKRFPTGADKQDPRPPAAGFTGPPPLQAPLVQVPYGNQYAYPQQFPQQMQGAYAQAFEPQGINLLNPVQQQGAVFRR